jgi:hypothetical protein
LPVVAAAAAGVPSMPPAHWNSHWSAATKLGLGGGCPA